MKFSPCIDQCTYEGSHCEGCGRSHSEIADTKKLVMTAVAFAQQHHYENIEEFADSIGKSIVKKLQKARTAD
jgi:predicted Fe-S protein YdhL (DUF1289 family)